MPWTVSNSHTRRENFRVIVNGGSSCSPGEEKAAYLRKTRRSREIFRDIAFARRGTTIAGSSIGTPEMRSP
jgi:hypothetical protein